MADQYKARVKMFDDLLSGPDVDLDELRRMCFTGIPEGGGRRSMCWRLLLNYLPLQRREWQGVLDKQRQLYKQFLDEMVLKCHSSSAAPSPSSVDHPLNPDPDSHWQSFFKDNEVLLQIDKDVRRLCPDINFFSQPTQYPLEAVAVHGQYERLHRRVQLTRLHSQEIKRRGLGMAKLANNKAKAVDTSYAPLADGKGEAHWEVVERILFLYAKLNPGQSYVQGMNEIVGPIYYVFASDPREEWKTYAEADCFFCFTNLMSDIRDFFIKTLDQAESGVNNIMKKFMSRLRQVDGQVYDRLAKQDIKPQFFAFRWLTLLLSQEFSLPDVQRIWDSLLSDPTRSNFLVDVCVAMVVLVRHDVLHNEFADNMKMLQNYPPTDVQIIISRAAVISTNGC